MVEQRIIRAIQSAQPSVTFMVANQNSPVPEHVFCEVSSFGDVLAGMPSYSNDEFEETINTIVLHRVSLTYNGLVTSNADSAVRHMARFLQSFQATVNLRAEGFSVIRVHDIQKIPLLKDVDMYIRYVLDVTLATDESDSFAIDVIDVVKIHGDFEVSKYDLEVKI